ncbi:MAG: hypothetical protein ABI759_08875 [Candidatus Solibacter sp.]
MNGRQNTRLRKALEQGYLDARCPLNQELVQAYGMWCWKLKLPMIWLERRTRYSRFSRVRLDMFTSANRITGAGQEYLKFVGALGHGASVEASPHDACWDHVERGRARELARAVLRAVLRPQNYDRNSAGEAPLAEGERVGRPAGRELRLLSA